MPPSVRNYLLMSIALIWATALATPCSSQVMVASSLFTNSSGFHQPLHQPQKTKAAKPRGVHTHHKRGINRSPQYKLFSWEDIQEFSIRHWKEWEKKQ